MHESILTSKECYEILKKVVPDEVFSITDYKIENFSQDGRQLGFSGHHLRLIVTILTKTKSNLIQQFFIKMKPDKERNDPFDLLNRQNNIFNRENKFYQMISTPNNWSAKFYGFYNERCLVFEDLSLHGYRSNPNVGNLDLQHCIVAMRTLAAFHATTLGYSGNEFNEILHHPTSELNIQYRNTDRAVIEYLINTFGGDVKRETLDEVFQYFYNSRCASKTFPNVINHGDLWGNNILFKYEQETPVHCRLVDYQTMVTAPPASDVMFFLHVSTTREFRKAHTTQLLKIYYEQLEKEYPKLATIFPENVFLQSCEEYSLPSKLLSTRYKSVLFMQNITNFNDFDFFFGGKAVEKYIKEELKNVAYRNSISPVVEDLIECIKKFNRN